MLLIHNLNLEAMVLAVLVVMPKQGNTVESCILTKWLKHEGEAVKSGEPLFAYETDKSAFEENAQADGMLLKILREEGDDVPVMEGICVIGSAGEDISGLVTTVARPEDAKAASQAIAAAPAQQPEQAATTGTGGGEYKASPRARHLADSMGLNAEEALPTGPDGRVIERDIYALADGRKRQPAAAEPPAGGYKDVPLSNIRKRIAESMHKSLSEMAQLTHHSSADASSMMNYRAKIKAKAAAGGVNITLNDMVLFAASRVLKRHPDMNAHYLGDKMRYFSSVNLGMAVDTERGLMVPTIFNADRLTLEELSINSKEVADKCRAGAISPDMLSGGTFTVSNLGVLGVELYTPVINPPQTGIIGVCAILDRLRRKENGIELYPAMGISLTYDHRAVDGAPASRFLQELCQSISKFETFLSESQGA
jgi:pyruvate dehydrogenase E2 component (dihydrolipoamide acetyltransferase)